MLYQNDDFGKDYLIGLKDGLGDDKAGMVVKEASYETSEPTVDSQVVTLQGSGADVFLIAATPKFAAQAIRKSADLGWDATRYITNVSVSIATILKPAGLDKSKGLITGGYVLDVTDPRYKDEPAVKAWKEFTDKYMSATAFIDANAAYGFGVAATMIQVLKQCGGDLSRENVMKQAANLKSFAAPLLIPGITLNTSPDNFAPVQQLQLLTFNGTSWEPSGGILQGWRFERERPRGVQSRTALRGSSIRVRTGSKSESAETIGTRGRSANAGERAALSLAKLRQSTVRSAEALAPLALRLRLRADAGHARDRRGGSSGGAFGARVGQGWICPDWRMAPKGNNPGSVEDVPGTGARTARRGLVRQG